MPGSTLRWCRIFPSILGLCLARSHFATPGFQDTGHSGFHQRDTGCRSLRASAATILRCRGAQGDRAWPEPLRVRGDRHGQLFARGCSGRASNLAAPTASPIRTGWMKSAIATARRDRAADQESHRGTPARGRQCRRRVAQLDRHRCVHPRTASRISWKADGKRPRLCRLAVGLIMSDLAVNRICRELRDHALFARR